ncbi:5-methylcytosine-specific restriction endonuclease system specificity protein McrC [Brachyspira aalborgi]|uniref:5-methylcytosine-specific restriction endonuclease system specificity protein McrC n=1 Tax=Brachyspira aalborgi TaxID=29522 RepID=A0A5C8ECS1_9SPIR|nr:5-methylcytosine-specific restriction endonuclease system specificity protein McrC [Brachyspira aalborgi]TXJ34751.1 5-methylcytosine-specific restriction endonuclease system specificity protein McrC [Brachyspira aalborgi]
MNNIPIKNIYYMLCYAWNIIDEINDIEFGDEKFENIYNLMAKILDYFLNKLIKRGFYKNYILIEEDLSMLKGKIDFSKSIKTNVINQKRLICQYDILSTNILFNQIIKSTLNKLINYKNIDGELKNKLIILNRYFIKIKDIKINNNTFKSLKYHRNNIHYKFIINICKLVYNNLILDKNYNENSGRFYIDKNENKTMHRIYEKFVLNYYKINYQNFTVKSQPIKWQIKNDNFNFIPNMKTDITIYNKEKCLIIDTKYYKEILKEHKGKKMIRPSHLYQIYAYMNNIKFKGNIKGILLYAGTNEIINKNYQKEKFDYKIQDKYFSVRILDLNKKWENIEIQLNEIVEEHFNIVK